MLISWKKLLRNLLFGHPGPHLKAMTACPSKLRWSDEGLERDLYIKTPTVTILAMDGRRRWLDIKELVSHYFYFPNISYTVLISFDFMPFQPLSNQSNIILLQAVLYSAC